MIIAKAPKRLIDTQEKGTSLLDRVSNVAPLQSEVCGLSRQEADRYLEQRRRYDQGKRERSELPQLATVR